MTYDTKITSKGTITIAAPLRKSLGLKPGQTVALRLNADNQIVLEVGTNLREFKALRTKITKKIPGHLKGLSGEALREAAAKAWISGHRND